MRLRHIEVFHAVRRTGSITEAAEMLGVSQPAASKALKHAEDQLGFKLFRRVRGRLYPTAEAEILYTGVDKVYRDIETVRRVARNLRKNTHGFLRIGCLPSLSLGLLPESVNRLQEREEHFSCEIQTYHSKELIQSLLAHETDLVVTFGTDHLPGTNVIRIGEAEIVYIEGTEDGDSWGGRLRPDQPIALDQIDHSRRIGLSEGDPVSRIVQNALESDENQTISGPSVIVQTYYLARALVQSGRNTCALVDEFTARANLFGPITARRLSPSLSVPVCVMLSETRPVPRIAQAFIQSLKDVHLRLTKTC